MVNLYVLILAPLVGFLINGLMGKSLPKSVSGIISSFAVFVSFVISSIYFFGFVGGTQAPIDANVFDWITAGETKISFGLLLDQLSGLWLMIITGIGFLIHVYSIGYMHDDENFSRFFAYLNLFIFFMLLLVLGNNFLVMFIGWEGVGLCSYLLIGFWFKNQPYNDAAKKAFIMNRIGDLGFLIGMFLILFYFKTLNYGQLKEALASTQTSHGLLIAITMCLFVGAMGKSAQLPLYTWLPDAMAGPTPVSALIHAATMVTAGIFLIARANFLFSMAPETLSFIAGVGAVTALFAATIGVLQNDIKKVLAYSTVSQLGLMFLAMGVGAYTSGVFHVTTHAFFKACLFLGSGSVIHAMGGEQDIRNMGGLKKWMSITFITFLLSSIAIAGVPPFSGFFSKDEILAHVFEANKVLWVIGSLASFLTAFYMFRLVILTFFGSFRGTHEQEHHLHESPATITIPLVILAVLAVLGGLMGLPEFISHTHWLNSFLAPIFPHAEGHEHMAISTEFALMGLATALAVIGIGIAYSLYVSKQQLPAKEGELKGFAALVYDKYRVDELYNAVFVKPISALSSTLYTIVDKALIDGQLVEGTAGLSMQLGKRIRSLQSGNIGFYLLVMVVAISLILTYVFI
ncbi:MAG: NADH-quinone oxidoreductase subunit L [Chitinophagales bacterium]|nr:NADH-quinone oxidoreductase subunit L [Chitinophagales bacterium]